MLAVASSVMQDFTLDHFNEELNELFVLQMVFYSMLAVYAAGLGYLLLGFIKRRECWEHGSTSKNL